MHNDDKSLSKSEVLPTLADWQSDFDRIFASGIFDHDWYLARYPDVALSKLSPLEHYVKYGALLGRLPNSGFDIALAQPREPYVNPLVSYIETQAIESDDGQARPLVSVICITYNQSAYVAETLESIFSQETNFEFEVIVGDDNSQDETSAIISDFARRHPNLQAVLRRENLGANANFEDLARKARGRYLAMCEGDDYWTDPSKLQRQVDFLESRPEYTICFHPVRVAYDGEVGLDSIFPAQCPQELSLEWLVRSNWIQTNSVMYRWRYSDRNVFNRRSDMAPGDWYLHLMHAEVGRIGFIDRVMAVYRKNAGGMWASHRSAIERHKKFGNNEIEFFRQLYGHFGGLYNQGFLDAQNYLFDLLFNTFLDEEDYANVLRLVEKNPDLAPKRMGLMGFDSSLWSCKNPVEFRELIRRKQRVSVVVTSYNHARYIRRCLDNVLSQTGPFEIEIIVGDDCSSDGTAEIIAEYKEKYPDIFNVRPRPHNLGMLRNMEDCLDSCTGNYVAFCEGDDYWLSDRKLARQMTYMRQHPETLLCFNWVLLHVEKEGLYIPHPEQGLRETGDVSFFELAQSPLTANFSCFLARASAIENVSAAYFEHQSAADWLFALYIANRGKVSFLRELLSVYTLLDNGQWSGVPSDIKTRTIRNLRQDYGRIFGVYRGFEDIDVFAHVTRLSAIPSEVARVSLDFPVAGTWARLAGPNIELRGWVLPSDEAKVALLVSVNQKIERHIPNVERPDVANTLFPGEDVSYDVRHCGFALQVPYDPELEISISLEVSGRVYPFVDLHLEERDPEDASQWWPT